MARKDKDHSSGRARKGTRQKHSNVAGAEFQPRNMLGRYEVKSSFLEKHSKGEEMWIEIHELVESGTAFFASFNFGAISGVMLLAGSRRALQSAVQDAEAREDESEGDLDDEQSTPHEEDADDDEQVHSEDDTDEQDLNSFERPPDLDRPGHAFEKNTFRNPKWFAQWRGQLRKDATEDIHHEQASADDLSTEPRPVFDGDNEGNKAHFDFSTAACRDFEATFSCPSLGAKDIAMQGWKLTSKPSPATASWSDIDG